MNRRQAKPRWERPLDTESWFDASAPRKRYFLRVTVITGDSRGFSGCWVISPISSSLGVERSPLLRPALVLLLRRPPGSLALRGFARRFEALAQRVHDVHHWRRVSFLVGCASRNGRPSAVLDQFEHPLLVEVSAASLFEAAALAVAEFRQCGFTDVTLGAATSLAVTVQQPTTTHTLRMSRLEAWLNSAGKSPGEQALKIRLKGVLELAP